VRIKKQLDILSNPKKMKELGKKGREKV